MLDDKPALCGKPIHNMSIQTVKPEIGSVLKAYQVAKDSKERGRIYRQDIEPILAAGERLAFERYKAPPEIEGQPIQAANTLGSLVGNIVSQRTLSTLVAMRPVLKDVVTDFSDEQIALGQTVTTRTAAMPTVQNFNQPPSDATMTDYPITLDQHKQAYFSFSATEYLSTNRNLVEEHSEVMAVALGNHLVDTLAALVTDAFTSETTGAAATKDFSAVTTACAALNTAGAPDVGRAGWVNTAFAEALSNDEVMAEYLDKGSDSAYSRWRNVRGFRTITEFPSLPGNSINLIGFFFQRNALLIAARPQRIPTGARYPGLLEIITEPGSGLSVVNNVWVDPNTLAMNTRLILMYGVKRGLVGAGHKFVTS